MVGGESQRVAEASSAQTQAASSTASSIEDVTAGIRMVADNAGNAARQADESLDQSTRAQTHLTELRGWALGQFAGSTPVLSIAAIAMTFISSSSSSSQSSSSSARASPRSTSSKTSRGQTL